MGNFLSAPPIKLLKHIDLRHYDGMYEEIARFPFKFEDDKGERATWFFAYEKDPETLSIRYKCWDMFGVSREDKERSGELICFQFDTEKVYMKLFIKPLFVEEYSILDMESENEQYLIFVSADNHVIFILSRKTQITKTMYAELKTKLAHKYHLKVNSLVENRKAVVRD